MRAGGFAEMQSHSSNLPISASMPALLQR
jgi:hypothetical protein